MARPDIESIREGLSEGRSNSDDSAWWWQSYLDDIDALLAYVAELERCAADYKRAMENGTPEACAKTCDALMATVGEG